MINGLVNGLLTAGPQVLAAITGVANGAITAAKKALGIKSPSKVFASIGENTAAGMAVGVDSGAEDTQSAIESMVAPPAAHSPGWWRRNSVSLERRQHLHPELWVSHWRLRTSPLRWRRRCSGCWMATCRNSAARR